MNLFFKRVLSALAQDALTLIPINRAPHVRDVINRHPDFGTLSARQKRELASELLASLPTETATAAPKKKTAAAKKGKKK